MIISSVKSCIVIICIFLLKADYDVLSVILGGLISYAVNLLIQIYILYKITGWKLLLQNRRSGKPFGAMFFIQNWDRLQLLPAVCFRCTC